MVFKPCIRLPIGTGSRQFPIERRKRIDDIKSEVSRSVSFSKHLFESNFRERDRSVYR